MIKILSILHSRRLAAAFLVLALVLLGATSAGAVSTKRVTLTVAAKAVTHKSKATTYDPALRRLLPASIQKSGIIRNGVDPSYVPWNFYAHNGKTIIGMAPDLEKIMGKLLGVKFVTSAVSFDSELLGVQSGRFDMAFDTVSVTPQREKVMEFVDWYLDEYSFLIAKGNPHNITGIGSICGLRAAAVLGSLQAQTLQHQSTLCTQSGKQSVTVQNYPTVTAVLLALASGQTDCYLGGDATNIITANQQPTKYQVAGRGLANGIGKDTTGLALKKGSPLAPALLATLREMYKDRSYQRVFEKWNVAPAELYPKLSRS